MFRELRSVMSTFPFHDQDVTLEKKKKPQQLFNTLMLCKTNFWLSTLTLKRL